MQKRSCLTDVHLCFPLVHKSTFLRTWLVSSVIRKPAFCIYTKTKTQISCMVTAQLISTFVSLHIVQSLFFLNFKPLAIFCDCTARFVSDLVVNPEDRFSCDTAHMFTRGTEVIFVVNIFVFFLNKMFLHSFCHMCMM